MSKIELGPLPEPTQGLGAHAWAYSADQMRSYAEQEVARERERCAKVTESLYYRDCKAAVAIRKGTEA